MMILLKVKNEVHHKIGSGNWRLNKIAIYKLQKPGSCPKSIYFENDPL